MARGSERDPRELGGAWTRHQRHAQVTPAPDLAPVVEGYWAVEWRYETPYRQKIVPYPHVHVSAVNGAPPRVHGVATRYGVRLLEGEGSVVGARVRPGAFRPFLRAPVRTITDRDVAAAELPGLSPAPARISDVAALEGWLRSVLPEPDPAGREAGEIVEAIRADPGVTRVDVLARTAGHGVRRLQRLFADHVGVGPKWVIRRYRLHEVTERMAAGVRVDWAALAAELGFADQAHLVRDFTALFGEPPTAYALRYSDHRVPTA